jgi:hypothetical protein
VDQDIIRWLAIGQSGYYVITGIWPLISLRAFETVTGPKTDKWLVQMVGLLAAAVGVPLLLAVLNNENVQPQMRLVALLSAISFLAIDVWYSLRGVISKIYLADALIQVVIIILWLYVGLR